MTPLTAAPERVFDHLERLTDDRGLFEHARYANPRREHGYCVDDVARALVVVCREPDPAPALQRMAGHYLGFLLDALASDGSCHNRMDVEGVWRDEPGLGDWWGRAVWGLGVAAVHAPHVDLRARAVAGFRLAARGRSPDLRGLAFAALGGADVLREHPPERAARELLRDAAAAIGSSVGAEPWPWPEPHLRYGNGALAEALILAGGVLPDAESLARGLRLLRFLLRVETRAGHLSVTPVGGRSLERLEPGFDQQPIEAAALADACAAAHRVTADPQWLRGIELSWRWFLGDNDSAMPMFDERTGAGFDGLHRDGRNANQGAESTLAGLSTAQHAARLPALR